MSVNEDIKAVSQEIEKQSGLIEKVFAEFGKRIVGQHDMVEKLFIGLITRGHILLEGVPGLAKTLAVETMSEIISVDYQRIQFTPDLLPSDLIGTLVYNQKKSEFETSKGPLFTNIVLADEINRAPAKVQSALLEAMQEKQITIGDSTYKLDDPFLVLATENPVEQEGTYPLPEAQVDRFMLKVIIDYPDKVQEKEIMKRYIHNKKIEVDSVLTKKDISYLRELVEKVYLDEKIMDYIIDIVFATRQPEKVSIDKELISFGASPRASIYLALAAKANALIRGRGFVNPEDIRMVGMDVLRHRVIPSYEAEAEGLTSEDLIERIFNNVEVP